MLITTFKSLLEREPIHETIEKIINSSTGIAILTTQFPSIVDETVKVAYLDIPRIFPTYLCNLSDYYPNLDVLIVRTKEINLCELVHKFRITIMLCDEINGQRRIFENPRQITVLQN